MKRLLFLLFLLPVIAHAQVIDISSIRRSSGSLPTINTNVSSLNSFQSNEGSPSASDNFLISGSNLTASITVAALTGYEYSKDNSSWSSSLTFTQSGGIVASQAVYVRLSASATGTPSGNIVCSSTGASPRNVSVTGTVISSAPTIILNPVSLSPFTWTAGNPSTPGQYTVSGAQLTANVLVTPPSWMEISGDGTTYLSNLTLTRSGTILSGQPVQVYVRGKASAAAGGYSGNIAHTSTGATTQNIAVNGTANSTGTTVAKFNFSQTSQAVTGFTNFWGDNKVTQAFTDAGSGYTLKNYPANWQSFVGTIFGSNGDGASTGSFSSLFPAPVVAGNYYNVGIAFSGSNYQLYSDNLPAGNYTVYIIGSVKSTVNNQITTPQYHVKFGSASDQMQNSMNNQDNAGTYLTFTGTLSSGQVLNIGITAGSGFVPGAGCINAIIIQKN